MKVIIYVFVLVAFFISVLLIKWQFIDSDKYLAIANERFKQYKIPSIRGSILSSNGTTLAYSEPRFDAYVWLPELISVENSDAQTRDEFIYKISSVIGTDNIEFGRTLSSGQQWIKIGSKITLEQRDTILDLTTDRSSKRSLKGVQFQYVNKRIYPENRLASQLLGYVSIAETQDGYKGVWGLEQQWDGILRPEEGYQATEYDSFGNYIAIGEDESIEPRAGSTIYTTINKAVQAVLEENLEKGATQFQAKSATGIIMDPKTGEIIAMANYPDFDPNNYSAEKDISVFGNLAVSTPYEIGSVGKIFSLAAAIDLGRVTPDTVILPEGHKGCEIISPDALPENDCKKNIIDKNGKKVVCICTAERAAIKSPMDIKKAIVLSDNIAFRHIALTMSYTEFHDYLYKFGVTVPTKIDTAGESVGVMKSANTWNWADQATYSYGHGYSLTPIEAIRAVGAVANNGNRMQTYIVSKIVDADNKTVVFKPKVEANILKPETTNTMIKLMNSVYVNQLKEARYKYLDKYYIALKSGTALIPYTDRAGYSDEFYATFVGFDASPDKKFILFVRLERPQVGELSWQNVRTVWLDTFIGIKDILKVKPYSP